MCESFGCVGGNGPKGWIANLGSWNYAWHQPRGYMAIFRKCAQVLWEEYLRDWVSECEGRRHEHGARPGVFERKLLGCCCYVHYSSPFRPLVKFRLV